MRTLYGQRLPQHTKVDMADAVTYQITEIVAAHE
jgi:hypothetical protein